MFGHGIKDGTKVIEKMSSKNEDRFKVYYRVHNNFFVRYFNMVSNYLNRRKEQCGHNKRRTNRSGKKHK
tara:strand:- start:457 stop:663 length:207 start_codon:yes stop_codon:yes gene_type:complete